MFTEPAHGGGSHPDLGAGKGPGNSLEGTLEINYAKGGWIQLRFLAVTLMWDMVPKPGQHPGGMMGLDPGEELWKDGAPI
ncbi:hypothetical protein AV530_015634 [Patagioenas fasciata monilis]|uniref:Uncharacterized protein n=1 Tax=Patagioenas fasciata monilis TaxID=372326 RepID=A0A1V4KI98_PATFA|nr:hypothetical protein AV530_015634 [Patagioenas fasciata monilis]